MKERQIKQRLEEKKELTNITRIKRNIIPKLKSKERNKEPNKT